jgi:hypothetical protein
MTTRKGVVYKPPFRHPNFIGLFTWNSAKTDWSIAYRH